MPKRPMRDVRAERLATRERDIAGDLTRLQGRTRNDLAADRDRGALSPLGHGSYSVKREERKRRQP
jgi:hypothetical protein